MSRKLIAKGMFFGVLVFMALVSANFAQEFRGTITGTVADPNGAVLPGATVVVKNIETNIATTVKTNDDGAFTVTALIPGTYTVSATGTGFKTSTRENLSVKVDDRLTVDFKLEIGSTAEVTIVEGTELLERGTVTTGMVITSRQVQELPLPEGAVFTLATQTPGINYTGDPNFVGPTANGNLAGFRTNGTAGNLINLDGSPNLGSNAAVAFTPPADAVQEFKVNTNSFDAQNGFTSGATVNVALKSGTNKPHGAIYYFNRDKSRTANNFFNNRQGMARPERKYFRLGGVLNGPVYIPKIYNGRNRTFFLFSYEKQNDNVAQPTTFFVPTALQRTGNFSEILGTTPIYDPASAFTGGPCAAGVVCRNAFAGNVIPGGRLNQVALNYLALYPLPNLPVLNGIGQFASNMNLHRPYEAYLGRIDHNISNNQKIFGKYYYSKSQEDRYNWIGGDDSPTRGFEYRVNKGGNVDYTSTLSSKIILDIRGSYNLFSLQRANASPISPADIGFTGPALAAFGTAQVMPRMDFASFASTNISNAIGSNRADYNEGRLVPFHLLSIQPTITHIAGNHTLRYGYDFRQLQEEFASNGFNAGRFLFDGTYTTPASNSSTALKNAYGRDLAAFLLGIPTANANSLIDNPTVYDVKTNYHGIFFQDDWRLTPKMTLNLGLRYELETGIMDSENRLVSGFDTTTPNPLQAAAQANFTATPPVGVPTGFNALGGLQFVDANNRAAQGADKNNFQPRVGVSYSINNKTVIRAGFAIFTAPFQIQAPNQSGFSTPTLFVPSTNNGLTFIATLANPFPSGVAPSPGSSQGLTTFLGRDLTVLVHDRKNAQYRRMVVGIQRELPFGLGLDATLVIGRGSSLPVLRQINYVPLQYLNTTTATFDAAVSTFLSASVANPFRTLVPSNATYNAATIARRSLLTPFPAFGNITQTEYNGTNSYNALEIQIVKRFTAGLSLNASYTYSQEKERTTRLNPQDADLTEQIGANDRPSRFALSAIYELPIGRGRAIGKNWNHVLDALVGGWQFQSNYEWQSGEPLLFANVFFTGDPQSLVSKIGKKDSQGRRYGIDIPAFDVSGFYPAGFVINGSAAPASIGVGVNTTQSGANTIRYFPLTTSGLRNQRFLNFNLGMSKNFRINEGMKFQIRVEAVNLLNNPYFSAPNLTPGNVPNLVDPTANNLGRFGFTTGPTRQPPRDVQIGGRFTF
jgi:hypothetical protein